MRQPEFSDSRVDGSETTGASRHSRRVGRLACAGAIMAAGLSVAGVKLVGGSDNASGQISFHSSSELYKLSGHGNAEFYMRDNNPRVKPELTFTCFKTSSEGDCSLELTGASGNVRRIAYLSLNKSAFASGEYTVQDTFSTGSGLPEDFPVVAKVSIDSTSPHVWSVSSNEKLSETP